MVDNIGMHPHCSRKIVL